MLLGLLVPVLRVQHVVRHRHGDGPAGPRTPDDRLPLDHVARLHQLPPQPVHLHHLQQRVPESLQEVLQICRCKDLKISGVARRRGSVRATHPEVLGSIPTVAKIFLRVEFYLDVAEYF